MPDFTSMFQEMAESDEVDVSSQKIGDKGVTQLAQMITDLGDKCTWVEIYLDDNDITDKGAIELTKALMANTSVATLSLMENKITGDCFSTVGEMLRRNSTLKALDLRKNRITDDGCKVLAEGIAASTTENLVVYLKDNDIGDTGAIVLAEAVERKVPRMKQLDLDANSIEMAGANRCKAAAEQSKTEINCSYQKVGFRSTGYRKEGTSTDVQETVSATNKDGSKIFASR